MECVLRNCGKKEKSRGYCKTHYHRYVFMPSHPLYYVWSTIRQRCLNEKHPRYQEWGGRGIKICDRWAQSYDNFAEDMGARPSPFHQLDRIDNDGDYTLDNCRWATAEEQTRNRRVKRTSRSGVKGVEERLDGKFVARITINKKRINLGTFHTLIDAEYARRLAEARAGF